MKKKKKSKVWGWKSKNVDQYNGLNCNENETWNGCSAIFQNREVIMQKNVKIFAGSFVEIYPQTYLKQLINFQITIIKMFLKK